jgi:hypothetical protein
VADPLSLRHPKTGATVKEALDKVIQSNLMDVRSPDTSPIIRYLPTMPYEEITSPVGMSILTPRKALTPVAVNTPIFSTKKPISSPIMSNSNSPIVATKIVYVEENGDGTYSPIKAPEYRNDPFAHMDEVQQLKAKYDMDREIRDYVRKHPNLNLELLDPSQVECAEMKAYLEHIKDVVGTEEKVQWLDMGMEAIYNLASFFMERVFNIPMKSYFDSLKGRIKDYRALFMKDPVISNVVGEVLPSITSSGENKSTLVIFGIFLAQIVIGCGAAAFVSWKGGSAVVQGVGDVAANLANKQLDAYMFQGQSLLESMLSMGKNVFNGIPTPPAQGVKVDV